MVTLALPFVSAQGSAITLRPAASASAESVIGPTPPATIADLPVTATSDSAVDEVPVDVTKPQQSKATSPSAAPVTTSAEPTSTTTGVESSAVTETPVAIYLPPVAIYLPVIEEIPASGDAGCPAATSGTTPGAPARISPLGVAGTTSADLQAFAQQYNVIRVANCLPPVPFQNIRFDSCMEDRLFWMAEDPSTDPMSAWGHIGSVRSDGVPSIGCDGNLAGGSGNSGATVAQKWWDSSSHRASLYKPTYTGGTGGVCILFAMTHGGVPNEPLSFTRAAARWVTC